MRYLVKLGKRNGEKEMVTVDCIELSKVYPTIGIREEFLLAIAGISFNLNSGKILSIRGPSGSGKTTLIKILASFLSPSSGKVLIDDINLNNLEERELQEFRREILGYIPQDLTNFLVWDKTTFFNVSLGLRILGESYEATKRKVIEILKEFDLYELSNTRIGKLSGGELQKATLAAAIVKRPAFLLCDEPTGELDRINAQKVLKILQDYNTRSGATIIIVTHEMELIPELFDFIYIRSGMIQSSKFSDEYHGFKCRIQKDGFIQLPSRILELNEFKHDDFFVYFDNKSLWLSKLRSKNYPSFEIHIGIDGTFHLPTFIKRQLGNINYLVCESVSQGVIRFRPITIENMKLIRDKHD